MDRSAPPRPPAILATPATRPAERSGPTRARSLLLVGSLVGLAPLAAAWAGPPTPRDDGPARPAAAPLEPVPAVWTLDEALELARAQAPALEIARGRLTLGEAELEAARPLFIADPELWLAMGARLSSARPSFELQLQAAQRVEIAGERRLRRRLAERVANLTQRDLERIAWELEVRVREAFYVLLIAQEQLELADRLLSFAERTVEIARIQAREGEVAELDVRLATAQRAQAGQAALRARASRQRAAATLAGLLGIAGEVAVVGDVPPPRPARDLARQLDRGAKHQRDRKVLITSKERAQAALALAKRDVAPEPAFGLYVGHELDPFAGEPMDVVMGTVGFSLPIWQRNRGAKARARAELTVAERELAAFDRAYPARLQAAVAALDAAAEQVALYDAAIVPGLETQLQMLERAYQLGELDALAVSVARERFAAARQGELEAKLDYVRSLADLESLLGTFPELGPPVRVDSTALTPSGPRPPRED